MKISIDNAYEFRHELRSRPDADGVPLSNVDVTAQLAALIEETFTTSVLAEQLPDEVDELQAAVRPHWSTEPVISQVEVQLSAGDGDRAVTATRRFDSGPWVRASYGILEQLRRDRVLGEDDRAYRQLLAIRGRDPEQCRIDIRPLQSPDVPPGTLEELGVRNLGEGELEPDRPVLVSSRLAAEAIDLCEAAGSDETGGAVLGRTIRLLHPLPHTETRIVTLLTTLLTDRRHAGSRLRFHISPDALAEAAQVAALRGKGESVLTIFHTHGWGCGECNQKACPLAECYPSLQDYELESLFPSKALLLPIAGRKHGAPGRRPVLQIHAWRGGELKPIRWRIYED